MLKNRLRVTLFPINAEYFKNLLQVIIGPATVGGIQAGAFKIGDTAGTIDNIIQCKLYRPGSVGFVSKSVIILSSLLGWSYLKQYSAKFDTT